MCLANLYEGADAAGAVLTEIARIRFRPDGLELQTLFGETKVITGKVSEIDFVKSRVVLAE